MNKSIVITRSLRFKLVHYLLVTALFAACSLSMMPFEKPGKNKPVIIGYVGGYKGLLKTDLIHAEKLTHINYAFVNVLKNRAVLSNLGTDTVNFRNLVLLKKKNPALKILISIGGWSWSENFSDAVLTDTSRKAFAASSVAIIRKYKLDGVDIDWEYPDMAGEEGNIHRREDKQNFTLMFEAIRNELDVLEKETGEHKLLTTAVGGFDSFLDHSEMGKAQQYLDFINLMTYDYYYGSIAGHHTNLFASKLYPSDNDADKAIKAYVAAGVPVEKLVMGVAFYGKTSKLKEGALKGIGDATVAHSFGKGYTFIKDSLVNKKGFTAFRDKAAKAPYLFNPATLQFMTYDDEWSVKYKCKYVKKNRMGGVMFWEYSSDPKEYLLDVINDVLK